MTTTKFTFFKSFDEALQYVTDEQYGRIVRSIAKYVFYGIEPTLEDNLERIIWSLIIPNISVSLKRSEAGKKGGANGSGVIRNIGNCNAKQNNSKTIANQKQNNSDKDSDKDKDKDKDREMDIEKRFSPPTFDEVNAYCIERGNGIDAKNFVDFYTSKGWMVGKNKMKDWRAAVRTWERTTKTNNQTQRNNGNTNTQAGFNLGRAIQAGIALAEAHEAGID